MKKPNKVSVKGTIGLMKGLPEYDRPKKASGWEKFKSFREGYDAAKSGESKTTCPYRLSDEIKNLLLKRDRWLRGHEAWVFGPIQHKRNQRDINKAKRNGRR